MKHLLEIGITICEKRIQKIKWLCVVNQLAGLQTDDDGKYLSVMEIDMICDWPTELKLIEVPFDGNQEFSEIVRYLRVAADLLHQKILKRIGELERT